MGKTTPSSDADPLVIVGNGMVSWRLCQQLVDRGVHQQRKIVVFGEEPRAAYDRVNLTKMFGLTDPDELLLAKAEWYDKHAIRRESDRHILSIDREAQTVLDDGGNLTSFSDCVIATGSRAFVPEIDGARLPGVFVYRTIADVEAIKEAATSAKRGLVVGGGLLGLEAADELRRQGIETCIVQSSNCLMSRQLNPDSAGYLLREVASLGMSVRLTTRTESIEQVDGHLRVNFDQGEPMDVDLVVLAAGVRPRDELAHDAELPVAIRGGIIIDDNLQTEDPNVFAIGECVSHHGVLYGIVAPGYQQADCLAARFAGENKQYEGSDQSCRLKLLGVEVSVFGDYFGEGLTHVYRGADSYRSIVTQRGRLIGATVVGEWKHTTLIERAVQERRPLSQKLCDEFALTGELFRDTQEETVLSWPDRALICHCTSTNCGVLREAVMGGCATVKELSSKTGAGSVCGSCIPQLAEFVGEDGQALAAAGAPKGKLLLTISAVIGFIMVLVFFFVPGLPAAESVQTSYYEFTQIWQDSITKQITGYTLAGISVVALLLSVRKRIKFISFGNYGFWRAAHSWLGVSTIVVLFFHTGLHLGENLNLWLLMCFLGLNLAGAMAAIAVATEKRFSGFWGMRLRRWALSSHLVFFIPYPVLLGFHIAKVYLY